MATYDSFSVQTEFLLVHSPTLVVSMGNEVIVSEGNRELKGQLVRRGFTHLDQRKRRVEDIGQACK